jgi:hypothetical protein
MGAHSSLQKVVRILWLLLVLLSWPVRATPFVSSWLGQGGLLSSAELDSLTAQIRACHQQPLHLVLLVHGYDTPKERSDQEFTQVAQLIDTQFQSAGQSVVVLGLQWESAVGGAGIPWQAGDAYLESLQRARRVGRKAVRQLSLHLKEQFPTTHFHLFAHSLGCEVSAAALFPTMLYKDDTPLVEPYAPERPLEVVLLALTGADLDYDCWYHSGLEFRSQKASFRLLWQTVSGYLERGRDRVLQIRQVIRGMAAGSAFPRMTEAQYDNLFNNRAVVFDNREIPEGHALVDYFSAHRIARLVDTALYLSSADEINKPADLDEIDAVLQSPRTLEGLRKWLDHPASTVQLYALWRLENLLCGSSRHLADETLDQVTRLLRNTPRAVWGEREESPCQCIRQGLWPTEAQMTKAGAPAWSR